VVVICADCGVWGVAGDPFGNPGGGGGRGPTR
jgi:hypothetical protein